MKLHRFIGDFDFTHNPVRITDAELLHQMRDVLRLREGEEVIIGDGEMNEALGTVKKLAKDFAEVEITGTSENENEPETKVTLYCAILKRENFELVVQKATEVGVSEIVPIITERTVKLGLKEDRLEKIIREAAEQSERGIVPKLHEPTKFEDALADAEKNDANWLFDFDGQPISECTLQENLPKKLGIFIGPEGGWEQDEINTAQEYDTGMNKLAVVSLGKLTLRAETAAIIAVYIGTSLR